MRQARTGEKSRGQGVKREKEEKCEWGHLTLPLPLDLNGWVTFLFFLPLMLGVGFSITASNFWFPGHTLATSVPPSCLPQAS